MNMKIAICEDERYWSEVLKTSVSKWAAARKVELDCGCFASPQELINHLKANSDVDLLFLDIALGEKVIDGMILAKRIRKMGSAIPIIFVTSDALRAADGYLVEAMGYLFKPIDEDRLALFLDRIIRRQKRQKVVKIMDEGRVTNFYQKDVVYAEVKDHTIIYHTTQGSISHRGIFSEILANLDDECFAQIHRSFVIALDKVDSIKTTYPYSVDMIKNNETVNLPVSRKYINNLLEMYSDDLLEKMI